MTDEEFAAAVAISIQRIHMGSTTGAMAHKFLKHDATEAERLAYLKSCRWKLEIGPPPDAPIKNPDGREYTGQRVGELRRQHGGNTIKVMAPNGVEETADLSGYADDDRISVRFINLDQPTPEDLNALPPPDWEPPPGMTPPPGWTRTPEGWRPPPGS
jgi:hypothetical protein